MDVYQTDAQGYFVGVTTADLDPMDETNWLVPAGCVTIKPPQIGNEELIRWVGSGWVVEKLPQPEDADAENEVEPSVLVRAERDIRLNQSDWAMISDAPTDKVAWSTYRQALRDVPTQTGFPSSVTWPTKPS
jgi:hypothetical protein